MALPSGFHLSDSILLVLSTCFATSCPRARHMLRTLASLAVASRSTVGLQVRSLAVTVLPKELSLKSSSSMGCAIQGERRRDSESNHRKSRRSKEASKSICVFFMASFVEVQDFRCEMNLEMKELPVQSLDAPSMSVYTRKTGAVQCGVTKSMAILLYH